jgi:hypothetical protein
VWANNLPSDEDVETIARREAEELQAAEEEEASRCQHKAAQAERREALNRVL